MSICRWSSWPALLHFIVVIRSTTSRSSASFRISVFGILSSRVTPSIDGSIVRCATCRKFLLCLQPLLAVLWQSYYMNQDLRFFSQEILLRPEPLLPVIQGKPCITNFSRPYRFSFLIKCPKYSSFLALLVRHNNKEPENMIHPSYSLFYLQ